MTVLIPAISKRKLAVGIIVVISFAGILLLAATLWKVSHTLKAAEAEVAQRGLVAFHANSLDHPLPAGFETISSLAQFRDATLFRGRFYLCGPAGLLAYETNGSLAARASGSDGGRRRHRHR